MIGERDALGADRIEELLRSNADRIDVEVVPGAGHFLLDRGAGRRPGWKPTASAT
jgi:hypothetical protein